MNEKRTRIQIDRETLEKRLKQAVFSFGAVAMHPLADEDNGHLRDGCNYGHLDALVI